MEIQDEGSQLVAALVDARPGQRVCDYCAGAGGKTLALAATMENRGHLLACDTAAARLDNATRRLRRAGVGNAERHLLQPGDKWAKRHGQGPSIACWWMRPAPAPAPGAATPMRGNA